jgi:hypothetical protein
MNRSVWQRIAGPAVVGAFTVVSLLGSPVAAHAATRRPGPGSGSGSGQAPSRSKESAVNPYISVYPTADDQAGGAYGHNVLVYGTGFTPGGQVGVWGLCQCDGDPNNGKVVENVVTASSSGEIQSVFRLQCARGTFYGYARDETTNTQSNAPKTWVDGCLG